MKAHFGFDAVSFEIADHVAREALAKAIDWDGGPAVHNWRNHVGAATRAAWDGLTRDQKLAVAHDAEVRATAEEWD